MSKKYTQSLVSNPRLAFLENQCAQVKDLRGNVAEVGVYKGGSAKLLAQNLPHKRIHLFDTFEGMPEVNLQFDNFHREGNFANTALWNVQQYVSDCDNVDFWPGVFPESAAELKETEFCLVHVDVDIYQSTKDACEYFWPLLVPGGIMVFDDYSAPRCRGATKAINEFFSSVAKIETSGRKGTRAVKSL